MSVTKVAVVGADGRMGQTTCRAVQAADGLELVARVSLGDSMSTATEAGAQVMVDFTAPDAVMANIEAALRLGLHCVIGTSGFDETRIDDVRRLQSAHPDQGVVIAPNFALGAVLLMRFAREAAAHFESVEVIELHHPNKVDAPSGTAIHTATGIAGARRDRGLGDSPDATTQGAPEARGTVIDGVHIHSVRLRGLVAHEEVLFGNPGEQLSIRHDSFDRDAFMPGVLLAIRSVTARPGVTVGLEHLLDFA